MISSSFVIKTYAADARKHHIINACKRIPHSCDPTLSPAEQAAAILKHHHNVRKNEVTLLEQAVFNTAEGEKEHITSRGNFYPGTLDLDEDELTILKHFTKKFNKHVGVFTDCSEIYLIAAIDNNKKIVDEKRFGELKFVPCSLDFTGAGISYDEGNEDICVVPTDPFRSCTAIGCCDATSMNEDNDDLAVSVPKEIENVFDETMEVADGQSAREPEKDMFLVQARVLDRAGFPTAELSLPTDDKHAKQERQKKQVERYARVVDEYLLLCQKLLSSTKESQKLIDAPSLSAEQIMADLRSDTVGYDLMRALGRAVKAPLSKIDFALGTLDWELRLLRRAKTNALPSLEVARSVLKEYAAYNSMSNEQLLQESQLLWRAAHSSPPPMVPFGGNYGSETLPHIVKHLVEPAIKVMNELQANSDTDISSKKISPESLNSFGDHLKLQDTQKRLILGDSTSKEVDYEKWMGKASQMLLASSASRYFRPFAIPWVSFLNTPAIKFIFVNHVRTARVKSQNLIADIESLASEYSKTETSREFPKDYDLRKDHPLGGKCSGLVARWQLQCGTCWAHSLAAMIGTRLCFASDGKVNMRPSPADIIMSVYPWNGFYKYTSAGATIQQYMQALESFATVGVLPQNCAKYQCSYPKLDDITDKVRNLVSDQSEKRPEEGSGSTSNNGKAIKSDPALAHLVSELMSNQRSRLRLGGSGNNKNEMVSNAARVFLSKLKSSRGVSGAQPMEPAISVRPLTADANKICSKVQPIRIQLSKEHPIKLIKEDYVVEADAVREYMKREIMESGPVSVGIDMNRFKRSDKQIHDVGGDRTSFSTNHAVIVIGWRQSQKNPKQVEWLIQNSWNPASGSNYFYASEATLPFTDGHKWLAVSVLVPDCAKDGDGDCSKLPGNFESATEQDIHGEVGQKNDAADTMDM